LFNQSGFSFCGGQARLGGTGDELQGERTMQHSLM
jgi:hypothetical protein